MTEFSESASTSPSVAMSENTSVVFSLFFYTHTSEYNKKYFLREEKEEGQEVSVCQKRERELVTK